MELNQVLSELQYLESPNYLQGKALESDRDSGHIFRKALDECGLKGVYVLNAAAFDESRGNVPVVYVCEADTEAKAREIHRKVWNQNVVPFVLVVSRGWIRLYRGFHYDRLEQDAFRFLEDFNQISAQLKEIQSASIDCGDIWKDLGKEVTPEKRVDWRLLENLGQLDQWLLSQGIKDRHLAHSMIGKFVYFRYLRQRGILSDARLEKWGIIPEDVFSHDAKLTPFIELVGFVDEWLNGAVFPLPVAKIEEFGADRLRKVASVFHGEQVGTGQLPLFDIYDFSFIPIETLSVIYEQFLHATLHPSGKSQGAERGAYYTPVPVVNFMLDRLDSKLPLRTGMKVLDPSCGSGAFLVQCYRKLVERQSQEVGRRLRPSELGNILTNHIFGVDIDEDACQIAELSLALTLLDYIDPPDLTETKWKLPSLREKNIFCANAFDDGADWYIQSRKHPFQWIVGNPPWKELKPNKLDSADRMAWDWMVANDKLRPVGGNQLAEALVWRTAELLDQGGSAALLMPAMTLFKYESAGFRRSFLAQNTLWSVANFANLAEVLFAGRATLPAATFFFSLVDPECQNQCDALIETYSPLVANQAASRTGELKRCQETWNIVVNSNDLKEVSQREVADGQSLPWKIAMWGSPVDARVLTNVEKRFPTIGGLEEDKLLIVSQGMELRPNGAAETERHDELAGQLTLDVGPLKNKRFLLHFPAESLIRISPNHVSARQGRFKLPASVCDPPHVLVGASRNFSVYSEDFIVVPARQIGIASPSSDRKLLKALALYLNSDFVSYHQFLIATQHGIQKSINTLRALKALPVPFDADSDLTQWEELHEKIQRACSQRDDFAGTDLVAELNDLTFESLKLSARYRAAIDDLVQVRMRLTKGKIALEAVRAPTNEEQLAYATVLRDELDEFVIQSSKTRHRVGLFSDFGLVTIDLVERQNKSIELTFHEATELAAKRMVEARSHLMERKSQWLYFNRNLRYYEGPRTYMMKPLQRMQWTRTQAIEDARSIIADSLGAESPTLNGASIS